MAQIFQPPKSEYFPIASPRFLGNLSGADADQVFQSVKSIGDKAKNFLAKHGRNILAVINSISSGWGIGKIELDSTSSELKEEPLTYVLDRLVKIIQGFGFCSVYILVDRVDEITEISNDASMCFRFVESLVTNLHLLEAPGLAIKVFLWDQTEDYLSASGFRRDRIPVHMLNWTQAELEDMLSRRISAFSSGRISSLNEMIADSVTLDIHKLVCLFSKGSPRDVIRLVGRIIDEHTRIEDTILPISKRSIDSGIRKYSRERSLELYGSRLDDLSKIGKVSFTIGDLANDVFRISHQSAKFPLR